MAQLADIRGLPLILGGEIRSVAKLVGHGVSAVVLLRGPAGVGKTIFATQLAAHEALLRGGDVVYCCLELLPSELDAQLSGLRFGIEHRHLRVCNLPSELSTTPALEPRVFAAIVEVPEDSAPDIGAELHRALREAREAQLEPKVMVIDSLAEGYRLGRSFPRYLADALAKFAAEEGIFLVMLEEVLDQSDSTWTFIADVVLELAHHGVPGTAAAERRALTVRKNRFGSASVGPHGFEIHSDRGIEVYPRLSTYLAPSAREFLPRSTLGRMRPGWKLKMKNGARLEIPDVGEVVLVTSDNASRTSVAISQLVFASPCLRLDMASASPSEGLILRCGDPLLGPDQLVSDFCAKLEEVDGQISGLVIGDLEAIDRNIDPNGLRRALPVLIMLAKTAGLPIALFETAPHHAPLSAYLADTTVDELRHQPSGILAKLSSRSRDLINVDVEILPSGRAVG
jgi:KaiC/GvpD/RAD55 family RecA-like ATPase